MKQESAEAIALKALTWLVGNEEVLSVFLGATGTSIGDMRERAGDADFLGSVLEFLTMDDAWVREFCDAESISYEKPMQARQTLPGGASVHWT